jgi:hypothetical protein
MPTSYNSPPAIPDFQSKPDAGSVFLCAPIRNRAAISFFAHPTIRSARSSAVSATSICFFSALLSAFACCCASRSASRSSCVGMGGRSSIGTPEGLMMWLTTWRLCWDVRQPGEIAMTSPARRELLGSWTR